MPISIYLHIPFCLSKCHYCDFVSGYIPDEEILNDYIDSLCKEIVLFKNKYHIMDSVFTIYLGGGTPSLLMPKHLRKILDALQKNFNLQSKENTIEANPEDVTKEKAIFWKEIGFNRISLGFQSMNDYILKFLGRRNSEKSNIKAFEILRLAGFKNISVDLITSIRGDRIKKNLNKVINLMPEHISTYELSIEEGTRLHQKYQTKEYKPISTQTSLQNYWNLHKELCSAGYIHYEISNYAISNKFASIHNMNYWNYGSYLGFGLGVSGFINGFSNEFTNFEYINSKSKGYRWTNTKNLKEYTEKIKGNILPVELEEKIDKKKAIKEYIMVGLRKMEGIDLKEMKNLFNIDPLLILSKIMDSSLKKMILKKSSKVRLTNRGINLLNWVTKMLWSIVDTIPII